jgi:hypothetical protein
MLRSGSWPRKRGLSQGPYWAIIAEAMINSRPLGEKVPMSDQSIAELNAAFKL